MAGEKRTHGSISKHNDKHLLSGDPERRMHSLSPNGHVGYDCIGTLLGPSMVAVRDFQHV